MEGELSCRGEFDDCLRHKAESLVALLCHDVEEMKGWEETGCERGVTVFELDVPFGSRELGLRGVAVVPGTVAQVCDTLWNPASRRSWDLLFTTSQIVHEEPDLRLTRTVFETGLPFSDDRELSILEHRVVHQTWGLLAYMSHNTAAIPPPPSGSVRAFAGPCGIAVKANVGTPPSCTLQYVYRVDFGGSIPDVLARRRIKRSLLGLAAPFPSSSTSLTDAHVSKILLAWVRDRSANMFQFSQPCSSSEEEPEEEDHPAGHGTTLHLLRRAIRSQKRLLRRRERVEARKRAAEEADRKRGSEGQGDNEGGVEVGENEIAAASAAHPPPAQGKGPAGSSQHVSSQPLAS